MDKDAGRAQLRNMVLANLPSLVEAQMAHARGIKYLVARDKRTGKFTKLTEAEAQLKLGQEGEHEVIEVWEKDPSVQAFTDLLNRTLDKPAEHVEQNISGGLEVRWKGDS